MYNEFDDIILKTLQESDLAPWTPRTGDAEGIGRYLKRLQDELSNRNKQSKI